MGSEVRYKRVAKWEKLLNPLLILKIKKILPFERRLEMHFIESKTIFIHIPKAAGMSIVKWLYNSEVSRHRSASEVKRKNPAEFKEFYKFTITRHPVERLISAYNYLKKGGKGNTDLYWKERYLDEYENINEFIVYGLSRAKREGAEHFLPQCYFLYDEQGELLVDDVFQLENFEEFETKIKSKFDLSNQDMPHENYSYKNNESILTKNSIEIIEELYKEDFEKLGY